MFQRLNQLIQASHLGKLIEGWVIGCFVIALCLVCVDWFTRRTLKKALRHLEKTKNPWDEVLLSAGLNPLRLTVWTIGLALLVEYAQTTSGVGFQFNVKTPRSAGLILAFTLFAVRLLKALEQAFVEGRWQEARVGGRHLDVSTVSAGSRLLRMAVVLTMVVALMQVLGFNITGLLAFGGLGGLVAGLAARDMLANIFGALMVHIDRPFGPGDWIRSPEREIEGSVEEVGWRVTRIRTFKKRVLYVPNAVFSTIIVENASRMTHRRIRLLFGIRYDDAPLLKKVVQRVHSVLYARDDLDKKNLFIVRFTAFGPSSLDILVRVYTTITAYADYLDLKEAVLFDIMQSVEACGAEFAFPTSTIHIAQSAQTTLQNNPNPLLSAEEDDSSEQPLNPPTARGTAALKAGKPAQKKAKTRAISKPKARGAANPLPGVSNPLDAP